MAKSRARKLADLIVTAGVDIDGNLTFDGGSTSADLTFADNDKANFGDASDLQIYHDGSSNLIQGSNGSLYIQAKAGENSILATPDGGVNIYHDNSLKFETTAAGATLTGALTATNNISGLNLAATTATYSPIIYGGSSTLQLKSNTGEMFAQFVNNSAAELYYDNSKKLETTSTGIDVTGTVTADGLTVDGDSTLDAVQLTTSSSFPATGFTLNSNGFSYEMVGAQGKIFRSASNTKELMRITNDNDVSFYEDTGTTPKFFWDASAESLGIGTTSPSEMLQIDSADSAIRLNTTNAANNAELQLLYNNNLAHGMILHYHGNSAVGSIDNTYPRSQSTEYGDIRFRQSYAGTMTEHMRLTAYDGYLGLFTAAPKARLEVNLHAGADSALMNTSSVNDVQLLRAGFGQNAATTSNAGAKWGLRFVGRNDGTYDNLKSSAIYAVSEDALGYNRVVGLAFHTSSFDSSHAERMRIDSSGNVGIGTTAPSKKLHVQDSSAHQLQLQGNNSFWNIGTGWSGYYQDYLLFATSTGEKMVIDTNGNVGIGTNSPGVNLHISSSANTTAKITAGTNGSASLRLVNDAHEWDVNCQTTDTFAIYSHTDAVARLTILPTSGNVGIGTTSPNSKLEVATSANVNSYSDGAIQVVSSSPIAFVAPSNLNPSLNRWGFTLREGGEGHFGIRDYRNAITRVTIDDNGYVGIGTTDPKVKLDVYGDLSGIAVGRPWGNDAYVSSGYFGKLANDGSWGAGSAFMKIEDSVSEGVRKGTNIDFVTHNYGAGNQATMTLSADGDVGIGTTSPQSYTNYTNLHIAGPTTTGSGLLYLTNSNNSIVGLAFAEGDQARVTFGSQTNHPVTFLTNDTERMRIDTSGNLLVGTTSQKAKQTLGGDFAFLNDSTYSTSLTRDIGYYSSTASYGVQPIANITFRTVGDAQSAISFTTRSSPADYAERMRIDTSGNLLVGRTTSTGMIGAGIGLGTSGTGKSLTLFSSSSGNNGLIQFVDRNDAYAFQIGGHESNAFLYAYGSRPITFYTNANEALRIYSDGAITARYNGATSFFSLGGTNTVNNVTGLPSNAGTPLALARDTGTLRSAHFAGHLKFDDGYGVIFGNTGGNVTDTTLDDYEEGNWFPVLKGSTSGTYTMGGLTTGRYVKVGRLVTVTCQIQWTAGSGYSGNLIIDGLPYACQGSRAAGPITAVSSGISFTSTFDKWFSVIVDPTASFMYIIENGNGSYDHTPNVASAGVIYGITLTYQTS